MFSIRNTLAIDMMTAMPTGSLKRRIHDISSITKRIYAETITPTVTNLLDKVEKRTLQIIRIIGMNGTRQILQKCAVFIRNLSALPPDLYIASVSGCE